MAGIAIGVGYDFYVGCVTNMMAATVLRMKGPSLLEDLEGKGEGPDPDSNGKDFMIEITFDFVFLKLVSCELQYFVMTAWLFRQIRGSMSSLIHVSFFVFWSK